ncbi:MAG: GNAT family N-acetyltransferase [Porphyrobacter sp.]|nr:GNAT family N-acetyltransferase [Porphyrobacter sp.]
MTHPLDRPIWNALTTRQADLAVSSGAAVRIDPAYGPFAAGRDTSDEAQTALVATLRGPDDRIGVVEREAWPVPPGTKVLGGGDLVQMVFEGSAPDIDPRIELLTEADAPQMAALAFATEPGPWAEGTHRYGDFFGIRIDGRLAAMAGERLRLPGVAELSGVSTWPEYRGQGLAAALVKRVVRGFLDRGDTPFLHCYAANAGAIRLYESLGFRTRAQMTFTILALA